ncbi:MAG TPA: N-acetylmuramoyl-L-alanine amidase, partial [Prosthecobacter sp.]
PTPPKTTPKPAASSSTSNSGKPPRVIITTTGKGGGSKKSTTTSTPKTASKSTSAPAAPKMTDLKPEGAQDVTSSSRKGESEFKADDEDRASVKTDSVGTLPANGGWEIVKIGGRDYVTADSIRNFYNPLYGFNTFRLQGNHFWLGSSKLILKASVGSQEMLINNIKFILSFPVQLSGSGKVLFSRLDLCKLIDPVLCPSHIQNPEYFDTVVIDAGHGGHDAGARGVYGHEKDFALKMATVVRAALMQRGFKVILTRSNDTFLTLGGRVAIANQTPKSIFISLHFNSGGSAASGIETWALTPQSAAATISRGGGYNVNGVTGNKQDSANIALATAVHANVISRFKFVDRGIKRAQWSVLTGCKRPGILFEGGFVTNAKECLLVASDTYRQQVSAAIADAVVNYRKALSTAMAKQ